MHHKQNSAYLHESASNIKLSHPGGVKDLKAYTRHAAKFSRKIITTCDMQRNLNKWMSYSHEPN
jgi:hypothetical protein